METDIREEEEIDVNKQKIKERRIANLDEILHSHNGATIDSPPLEDGSIIEGKYMPALERSKISTKFPANVSNFSRGDIQLLKSITKKQNKYEDWIDKLTEQESDLVSKMSNSDTNVFERLAYQLSIISSNPKMDEETAYELLKTFKSQRKFDVFIGWINRLTEGPPEVDIKNS